ncbi:glutamate receptor 1-like [Procambarus clarkii]|uniref:glutamate receptor 1-like n=1 Tax=Procambarus clarkii TaxID=6728 RepID=UPI003743065E
MVWLVTTEEKLFDLRTRNTPSKISAWVFQTVTEQSPKWLPKRDGGRLIATTWLLAAIVFMSCYSGILTAMMTVPRVSTPIDSLADLVAQSKLPWRLEAGSMITAFLMESGDPVRQKAVTAMSGSISDCWAARQALVQGHYAAICDETTMKKTMSWDFSTSGKCHLYIARDKVLTNLMMALAFKKNSTFLSGVNKILLVVKEAGLVAKWLGEQITNTSQCLRPPSADRRDGISPLNLDAFVGPLLVLFGGMILGALTFVGEHFIWRITWMTQ